MVLPAMQKFLVSHCDFLGFGSITRCTRGGLKGLGCHERRAGFALFLPFSQISETRRKETICIFLMFHRPQTT